MYSILTKIHVAKYLIIFVKIVYIFIIIIYDVVCHVWENSVDLTFDACNMSTRYQYINIFAYTYYAVLHYYD